MSVSVEERRRRDLAIVAALRDLLPAVQVERAVDLWNREFGGSAVFSFSTFGRRLLQAVPEAGARGAEIFQALARTAALPLAQLQGAPPPAPPPPAPSSPAASVAFGRPAAVPRSAPAAVFDAVLAGLAERFRAADPRALPALGEALRTRLTDLGLTPEVDAGMRRWLDGLLGDRIDPFPVGCAPTEMRAIVHELWVWGCEAAGPVVADRFLHRAVHDAEGLAEAARFTPRQLL